MHSLVDVAVLESGRHRWRGGVTERSDEVGSRCEPGVLGVSHGVADHVLQEHLQDARSAWCRSLRRGSSSPGTT